MFANQAERVKNPPDGGFFIFVLPSTAQMTIFTQNISMEFKNKIVLITGVRYRFGGGHRLQQGTVVIVSDATLRVEIKQ